MNMQNLKRTVLDVLKPIGPISIVVLFIALANMLEDRYGKRVGAFLLSLLSQFWINLLGIIAILIIGVALYVVRQKRRVAYGLLEVGFAMAYGWYAINKVAHVGYVETISVIASVYLVVRGLDNITQGVNQMFGKAK